MIELVIHQRRRDLGGFEVGRVLPNAERRTVGPFVFFDHMGPVNMPPGVPRSVDVRPHPHIGLSTVTYLFSGEIMHRDTRSASSARGARATICTVSSPGWRCLKSMRKPSPPLPTTRATTFRSGTIAVLAAG